MADKILNIAGRFERPIRNALIAAFNEMKSLVNVTELANSLASFGITGALNTLANMQIEGIIDKHLVDQLNTAVTESGRMAIGIIPNGARTDTPFRFNILSPTTAAYLQTYELNLIHKIGANTREAIRNSLEADAIAGINPISTARNFRDTIGLTPKQAQAVKNFESGLRNSDRRVLNRTLRDKRFDPTINRAFKTKVPLTEAQISKMVSRYRERSIIYRSNTIARTEALRATSMGSFTSINQAVNEGAVERENLRRFWVYTRDKRTRNAHRQIPDLNTEGVEVDQPFITPMGPLMFPRDPNGSAANTIQCLHPDSIINFASINKLIRRWYEGEMIVLQTSGGHKLTVTINHPVLWEKGWISANAIKKGDRIVGSHLSDIARFNSNIQNTEATVQELFDSGSPSRTFVRGSSTVVDFHGEISNENIDIVGVDLPLRNSGKISIQDPFKKFRFSNPNDAFIYKPGSRCFAECLCILNRHTPRFSNFFMGRFHILFSLLGSFLLPFKFFGLTSCSGSNTIDQKYFVNSAPTKSSGFFDFINRITFIKKSNYFLKIAFMTLLESIFVGIRRRTPNIFKNSIKTPLRDIEAFLKFRWADPFKVQLFDVVSIHKFNYSGYVYNLEDDKSYHICNGLVNKNCRCSVVYRVIEQETE